MLSNFALASIHKIISRDWLLMNTGPYAIFCIIKTLALLWPENCLSSFLWRRLFCCWLFWLVIHWISLSYWGRRGLKLLFRLRWGEKRENENNSNSNCKSTANHNHHRAYVLSLWPARGLLQQFTWMVGRLLCKPTFLRGYYVSLDQSTCDPLQKSHIIQKPSLHLEV